jgi:hypothetical protein
MHRRHGKLDTFMLQLLTMAFGTFETNGDDVGKMKRCSGSREKAISQVDPDANVFLAKSTSWMKVPSGLKICTRSLGSC